MNYILQKDTLSSNIGELIVIKRGTRFYQFTDNFPYYYSDDNNNSFVYRKNIVENNPEWFLPEETNKK